MTSPMFFSPSWAEAVGKALDAGPDEATLAGKLQQYWDFCNLIRYTYRSSWALGVRDLRHGDDRGDDRGRAQG